MAMSTRAKIIDQWKFAMKAQDNCYYHLMYIGKLAGTVSPIINKNLPAVIYALEEMKKILVSFRRDL